jgi:photosystem II stability/assembly factor-like uncharacterized protein
MATDNLWWWGEAGTVVQSTDGLSWFRLPVANDIDYYGLASDGRRLVVAGDDGTILTSDDGGDNWTAQSTPNSRNLHGLRMATDCLSPPAARLDPDLAQWRELDSAGSGCHQLFGAGSLRQQSLVAVGEAGDISTSVNGTQWTTVNTGYPFSDHEGVTYGQGKWMAAGGYFDYDEDDGFFAVGTLYSSTDGQTWTRVPFSTGKRLRDITFAEADLWQWEMIG